MVATSNRSGRTHASVRWAAKLSTLTALYVFVGGRHPNELYESGINRDSFMPFVDLLKERNMIHHLDQGGHPHDYRRQVGVQSAVQVQQIRREGV
jgi:predicted ATPase